MVRSDRQLLEASKRGEREAFGALVERYQSVIYAVSYSRTGERSLGEDVAQDTFVAAWRQLDRLRDPSRLLPWLCAIARNLACKARRRRSRDREAALERPLTFDAANPFDDMARVESEQMVREVLSRVPATYRDVLVLYYCDEQSVRDVATSLGLSEGAALQRLSRGRRYLADGVTDLVKRSLHSIRTQRSLVGRVLAALPAITPPPHAGGATHSQGGPMIKLALVASVLVVASVTAYVVGASPSSSRAIERSPKPAEAAAAPGGTTTSASTDDVPSTVRSAYAPQRDSRQINDGADLKALPILDHSTMKRLGLTRGPGRGPENAPVTIVVFSDMQCQYSSRSVGVLDQLFDEYPGKLRLIVKHLVVHPKAALASEAVLAANAQGKFWDMYDLAMANQDPLEQTYDGLIAMAGQVGLDVGSFRADLDQHKFAPALKDDEDVAAQLKVETTPTFLINGKRLFGSVPIQNMRNEIDQALADL